MDTISGMTSLDPYKLPVNQGRCPSPTPVPTPRPGVTPQPTPVPTPKPVPPEFIGLSCLQTSPEPFRIGGVFVYFCLKMDASVVLEIAKVNGQVMRTMPPVICRAGNSQIFFNALDGTEKPLPPGNYTYTLKATTTDGLYYAVHHSTFNRAGETFGR
jgi:hypothetical protein